MADLLALLDDVSPEKPCGDYLEYDAAYLELGKNILGKPEDPISGDKAQPPNWRDIQKDVLALLQRSKDLQLVLYLLRALINQEGVSGFRDGLNLLLSLLEKYWQQIHPVLDPDDDLDPTARVNILEELSNFESVLRPLSLVALVDSKAMGRFSLRDFNAATDKIELQEGATKPDPNIIKAAFLDSPAEIVAATHQAIAESIDRVQRVESFVGEQVGAANGPDLSPLISLLKEMRYVVEQFSDAGLPAADSGTEAGEDSSEDSSDAANDAPQRGGRQAALVGGIQSRQDVLKTLDLICRYYAENEPSSPVPILLQRAKYLVTADFQQIVQNLLPDAVSQLALIKGPEPDEY